ncbi:MAG TPA: flavin reductase family protein [Halanaerobiales bacterium]|nr:flavin reductase family protein [Halanaerobiales bacterium]
MKKNVKEFNSCLQPSTKIIVSCRGADGEDNALAVGYACNCSFDPPMVMVGIVPERYSYHMVKETGIFVVNLVAGDNKEAFDYLGSHSGRDEDKLGNLGLQIADGYKVDAPLLLDFPVNIECKVVDSIKTGSHEMFAGKVLHIRADEELVNDDGKIDYSRINFL